MSEELTEAVIAKRLEKFQKAGIPAPIQATIIKGGDSNKFSKLESIKRGANRETFKKFIQVSAKDSATTGYQIPETNPKAKRGISVGEGVSNEHKVEVQNFGGSSGAEMTEANSIAAIFDSDGGLGAVSAASLTPVGVNTTPALNLNYETMGPTIDIASAVSNKLGVDLSHLKNKPIPEEGQLSEKEVRTGILDVNHAQGVGVLDEQLAPLIKRISEDTIRSVLNEYATDAGKYTYKPHPTLKNIIQIGSKHFKLVPVVLRKKQS